MKTKALLGCLTIVLLVTGACSTATNTNTNTNTANKNTAATPAPTSTPAPANAQADAASTAGKQDFTLHNETGVVIDQLFVSPSDKDEWGEDILGKDTLASGQSVEIVFSPKEKAAKWDMKVMDSEGTSIEWNDLNLIEISEVTLNFKDGKGTAIVK
jgi:hypothetical protein